eukprot:GHVN01078408.1.p1 GENE.GHVN01078408.1~~GHVN01078408.1.p1  ORF type:complete len:161 (+),score=7.92 GHVN01078408.1:473-955(+)
MGLINSFRMNTVGGLKNLIHSKWRTRMAPKRNGSFNVLLFANCGSEDASDILTMQGHPSNNHAIFQLASTMTQGLEGGMFKPRSMLTDMTASPVQGEWGAMSAMPGGIIRKYLPESPNANSFNTAMPKSHLLYYLNTKYYAGTRKEWWGGRLDKVPQWVK